MNDLNDIDRILWDAFDDDRHRGARPSMADVHRRVRRHRRRRSVGTIGAVTLAGAGIVGVVSQRSPASPAASGGSDDCLGVAATTTTDPFGNVSTTTMVPLAPSLGGTTTTVTELAPGDTTDPMGVPIKPPFDPTTTYEMTPTTVPIATTTTDGVGEPVGPTLAPITAAPTDASVWVPDCIQATTTTWSLEPTTTWVPPQTTGPIPTCADMSTIPYEPTGPIHTIVPSGLPIEVVFGALGAVPFCSAGFGSATITMTNTGTADAQVEPILLLVGTDGSKWPLQQWDVQMVQAGTSLGLEATFQLPSVAPGRYDLAMYGFDGTAQIEIYGP